MQCFMLDAYPLLNKHHFTDIISLARFTQCPTDIPNINKTRIMLKDAVLLSSLCVYVRYSCSYV